MFNLRKEDEPAGIHRLQQLHMWCFGDWSSTGITFMLLALCSCNHKHGTSSFDKMAELGVLQQGSRVVTRRLRHKLQWCTLHLHPTPQDLTLWELLQSHATLIKSVLVCSLPVATFSLCCAPLVKRHHE